MWSTVIRIEHLYIMGLIHGLVCRRCGAEEETSAHVSCECEALATPRHTHFFSFFLDSEIVRILELEAIWNCIKGTGLPWLGHQFNGHNGPVKKVCVHWDKKGYKPRTFLFYSILLYSTTLYHITSHHIIILYYTKPHHTPHIASHHMSYHIITCHTRS